MKNKVVKRTYFSKKQGKYITKEYEYKAGKYKVSTIRTKTGKLKKQYRDILETYKEGDKAGAYILSEKTKDLLRSLNITDTDSKIDEETLFKRLLNTIEKREGHRLTTRGLGSLYKTEYVFEHDTKQLYDNQKFEVFLTNAGLSKEDLMDNYEFSLDDINNATFNGDGTLVIGGKIFKTVFNYSGNILEEV